MAVMVRWLLLLLLQFDKRIMCGQFACTIVSNLLRYRWVVGEMGTR